MSYYERNKEKIKRKVKSRYKNDDLFRKEHIERVARYKKRKAEERKEERKNAIVERKVWRKVSLKGTIRLCCRVGYLSKCLGRTTQTVRLWEKMNYLPKSIRIKNHRYYLKEHFELIMIMWNKYKNNLPKFFSEIRKDWNKKI